jgi:DMSO/TMAO reductase YedYZ molybdopterin-dependent catalytic subunit
MYAAKAGKMQPYPEDCLVSFPSGWTPSTEFSRLQPVVVMSEIIPSRRNFLRLGTTGLLAASASRGQDVDNPLEPASAARPFLTPADQFEDVSRGEPKPHTLRGEALLQARLTPETWRLEITADDTTTDIVTQKAQLERSFSLSDGTALDYPALLDLGKKHRVLFLKAMQCLNIPTPLGQGLWEGVPLREILRLCGKMSNVRRIFYRGFHNNDPKQIFQSSLSYTEVMETPPGELPVFLAYRLNGEALTLERGGPVRMVVPWAHGFKSIKWLNEIFLTNLYQANDTYAEKNNDPESRLKTAAYLDAMPAIFPKEKPITASGLVISGWSGLERVETWLRSAPDPSLTLTDEDPAWDTARWVPATLADVPLDWNTILPTGVSARDILGFDKHSGRPLTWPLRYSMISWNARLEALPLGRYELRARAVDGNGFAQPEPRSIQKAGKNDIQVRTFEVTA